MPLSKLQALRERKTQSSASSTNYEEGIFRGTQCGSTEEAIELASRTYVAELVSKSTKEFTDEELVELLAEQTKVINNSIAKVAKRDNTLDRLAKLQNGGK